MIFYKHSDFGIPKSWGHHFPCIRNYVSLLWAGEKGGSISSPCLTLSSPPWMSISFERFAPLASSLSLCPSRSHSPALFAFLSLTPVLSVLLLLFHFVHLSLSCFVRLSLSLALSISLSVTLSTSLSLSHFVSLDFFHICPSHSLSLTLSVPPPLSLGLSRSLSAYRSVTLSLSLYRSLSQSRFIRFTPSV